jgi:predicted transcriptional regulator
VGETALVMTDKAKRPADTPKYRRITPDQRRVMRQLRQLETPQTAIAQALGVSQSTVSKWLSEMEDTTADASEYFRNQALPMAEKIVKKGRPSDLIKALQGVGVLEQERSAGLVIQIGVKDSDVTVNIGGETLSANADTSRPSPPLSVDMHSVTADK